MEPETVEGLRLLLMDQKAKLELAEKEKEDEKKRNDQLMAVINDLRDQVGRLTTDISLLAAKLTDQTKRKKAKAGAVHNNKLDNWLKPALNVAVPNQTQLQQSTDGNGEAILEDEPDDDGKMEHDQSQNHQNDADVNNATGANNNEEAPRSDSEVIDGTWATIVKLKKNRPVVNRTKPKADDKIKPIVVAPIDGNKTNALINAIFQKFKGVGYTISNKSKNQGPKIMCEKAEIKKEVMSILVSLKIEFNTFAQNEEKKKSFIVRGLSVSDDDQIIKGISRMLESLGYQTYSVGRFTTAYQKRNPDANHSRLFRVMLPFLEDESSLLNVTVIGSFHVKIEPKKGNRVVQCKNCQRYQHTAGLCGYVYRCVQCTGNHGPGECPRIGNGNLPVSCVNCEIAGFASVGHTANDFRNCHYYNKKVEKYKTKEPSNPIVTQPTRSARRIAEGDFNEFAERAKSNLQSSGRMDNASSHHHNNINFERLGNNEKNVNATDDDIKKQLLLTLIQLVQKL